MKWIEKIISMMLPTEEISGLDTLSKLKVYDETGKLYHKVFISNDVKLVARIDSRRDTLIIVIKNKKKGKICEK